MKKQITLRDQATCPTIGVHFNPNPANTYLVVDLHILKIDCPTEISFYDMNGRQILNEPLINSNSINIIDIRQLINGIYYYKIKSEKENDINGKIEIQH